MMFAAGAGLLFPNSRQIATNRFGKPSSHPTKRNPSPTKSLTRSHGTMRRRSPPRCSRWCRCAHWARTGHWGLLVHWAVALCIHIYTSYLGPSSPMQRSAASENHPTQPQPTPHPQAASPHIKAQWAWASVCNLIKMTSVKREAFPISLEVRRGGRFGWAGAGAALVAGGCARNRLLVV